MRDSKTGEVSTSTAEKVGTLLKDLGRVETKYAVVESVVGNADVFVESAVETATDCVNVNLEGVLANAAVDKYAGSVGCSEDGNCLVVAVPCEDVDGSCGWCVQEMVGIKSITAEKEM